MTSGAVAIQLAIDARLPEEAASARSVDQLASKAQIAEPMPFVNALPPSPIFLEIHLRPMRVEATVDIDAVTFACAMYRDFGDFLYDVMFKTTLEHSEVLFGTPERHESSVFTTLDVLSELRLPTN